MVIATISLKMNKNLEKIDSYSDLSLLSAKRAAKSKDRFAYQAIEKSN